MVLIDKIVNSLPGQFIIGGIVVSSIGYFTKNSNYPALAAVIAAIPIGMPSSVFVKDSKLKAYNKNLLIMTVVLLLVTTTNWYFTDKMKWGKYKAVLVSLALFFVLGGLYSFFYKKH